MGGWVIFPRQQPIFKRGHIVISDVNYLRLYGTEQANQIHAGVLQLEPNTNLETVLKDLEDTLPAEITALSQADFITLERNYWAKEPAGIIFDFGTIMGFVVGVVIVYQVLYSDVNDHLSEYATLKAIGYSDGQTADGSFSGSCHPGCAWFFTRCRLFSRVV